MNEWLDLSDGGWWHVAGWTMLHFLWLGSLVGLAAGVCRLVLRRSSASVRYAAALVCFIVLAALPIGIGAWLVNAQRSAAIDVEPVAIDVTRDVPVQQQVVDLAVSKPATATAPGATGSASASLVQPTNNTNSPSLDQLAASLALSAAEYLPWAWLTGTPLTFLLLTTGVIGAERLRRSSRILDDGPIAETCAELASSLRIGREVTIAICERIAAPVLIGIVRPMILLPSSALTGWSPDEIEMVLLHELAHVRRWDNLVNLLQRFVEAALFFHPAVWLVSRWVRTEREACCDAVVVGRTNRPHAYAETLVALAAQLPRSVLFHPTASSAMAAGPLRSRIHRILSLDDDPMLVSGKSLGVVMSGLLLTATLVVLNLPANGQGKESTAKVLETTERDEGGLRLPETKYLKIFFKADKENPVQTRHYPAPPTLARTLLLAFESLQRDPYGPQLDFESSWDSDRRAFEITAPLKAHEAIFSVYIPKAIEAESGKRHVEDAAGGMNDRFDKVRSEQFGDRIESVDSQSIAFTDDKLEQVPFVVGATKFADGDHITVTEIRGTAETFKPGNEYWIKGTYKLSSQDRATLGASVTVHSSTSGKTPHDPDQSVDIVRGSGEFTLKLPMRNNGWPHVSFYPADRGQSFGGVYFGTGDTVLAEWWKEPPKNVDIDGDSRIETAAVRQEMERQAKAKNQLKNLALALLNYNDAKGSLPAIASYDTFDRPLLSWRVHILPYLDVEGKEDLAALYKEFRLDEPWDSEHNRKLIPRMPAVFQNPNRPAGPFTSYVAVVGSDCVFDGTPNGTSLSQIPDGTANTVMIVEADEAVEWTRPADLNFYSAIGKAGLGGFRPNGWLAVFADGSVNLIGKDKSAREIRDLFTCGRKDMASKLSGGRTDRSIPSTLPLAAAIEDFIVRAKADEIGRTQPELTEQEVLTAIGNFDWTAVLMEPGIHAIFRKIAETHTLPAGSSLDFTTRVENRSGVAEGWWISLSVMTGPGQGFSLPIRVPSPIEFKTVPDRPKATFPSLEEQKLADAAYRQLGLELEAIGDEDLKRVKALGFESGLRVAENSQNIFPNGVKSGDILVGLHVWPTRTMQELLEIFERDDLAELNPLKYYVVQKSDDERNRTNGLAKVVTGRVDVPVQQNSGGRSAPTPVYVLADPVFNQAQTVLAEPQPMQPQSATHTPQQMAELVEPQPAQPQAQTIDPRADAYHPEHTKKGGHESPNVPPWVGELKAKLRDREPLGIVFFYVDGSEPCRRMKDMLQQFQRKYINLPLNVLAKDAEVERPVAVKYDIERVPALLFFDGDNQVLKKTYGDITESQFAEYLVEVAKQLPAESPPPPTLRYNGKTFEEWRTAWQTELSLEKRLEVVKALAAFGASGKGKEAAEAILEVANQLDWSYIQDSAKGRLQQACIDAFTTGEATEGYRIPSEAWFPLVIPIVEKSGDKFTFPSYLVNQLSPGDNNLIPRFIELSKNSKTRNWAIQGLKAVDPKLEDQRVLKCFRDGLGQQGQTSADAQSLIYHLSYSRNPGGGHGQNTALRFVPELEPYLFDTDERTRRVARRAINWIQPADARELVKRLHARLADETDKDRTEVIRALAAVGQQALPAESSLEKIALSDTDPNRYPAAVALERIRDNQNNASVNLGIDIQSQPFEPHRRQLDAERRELFPDGIYPPFDPMLGGGGGGGGGGFF